MTTIYDDNRPVRPMDKIMLNAMEDPKMIRERMAVTSMVIATAFAGISQPGRTCPCQSTIRLVRRSIAYMAKKIGKREPFVASESEELTG